MNPGGNQLYDDAWVFVCPRRKVYRIHKIITITIIDIMRKFGYNTDIQRKRKFGRSKMLENQVEPVDNIERIISIRRRVAMKKFECEPCGYIYDPVVGDPDSGIAPGTAFEDIPDDWVCPICGLGKDVFVPAEG